MRYCRRLYSDAGRTDEISNKYDVQGYLDYHELIGKVDAVSIAVPTSLHALVACDFLEHGIHCLVEKPVASNLDEAQRMINEAERHGAKIMVGHIERFNPAVQKLKQLITQGVLGKVIIVSTRRVGPFVPRIRDVGIIVDTATHDIDVIKYLVDKEPLSVYSKAGNLIVQKDDHAIIVMDYRDAVGCIEGNWYTPHKVRTLVANGTEGICYLDYIKQELQLCTTTESHQVEIEKIEPLRAELSHFLDCVENNKSPLVDGREGAKILKIALEASATN